MEYRTLGRTGWNVSTIGFGAWAIGGGDWGHADDAESMRALHAAIDSGVPTLELGLVRGTEELTVTVAFDADVQTV